MQHVCKVAALRWCLPTRILRSCRPERFRGGRAVIEEGVTMSVSVNRRRSVSISIALLAAFFLVAQPVSAAGGFGAKLSGGPWFPSNAYPGTWCDHEIDGGSDTYRC